LIINIFCTCCRVSYIEFLKPFALRKQIWRHGNNMLSLLQHPQPELPIPDIVEPPQKGLHGITAKLRQKVTVHSNVLKKINLRNIECLVDETNSNNLSRNYFEFYKSESNRIGFFSCNFFISKSKICLTYQFLQRRKTCLQENVVKTL